MHAKVWRCWVDGTREGDYCSTRDRAEVYKHTKKLAMRRYDGQIEVFIVLSSNKSPQQLGSDVLHRLVKSERAAGDEWKLVLSDESFELVLPKEDANAAIRRGLQHGLRVQSAWLEQHTPRLSNFSAGTLVLSPDGHASRTVSADVPSGGDQVERRTAVVTYQMPPSDANAEQRSAARDAQRHSEQQAILSLDPEVAAIARSAHASTERDRMQCKAQAKREREELFMQLLAASGKVFDDRYDRDFVGYPGPRSLLPWRSGEERASGVLESAKWLLLHPEIPELEWLFHYLIPSLQCYLYKCHEHSEIDFSEYLTCTQPDSNLSLEILRRLCRDHEPNVVAQVLFCRGSLTMDAAADIAGLDTRGPLENRYIVPWLTDAQIEEIMDAVIDVRDDLEGKTETELSELMNSRDVKEIVWAKPLWLSIQAQRTSLHDHNARKLSPDEARALLAVSTERALTIASESWLNDCVGLHGVLLPGACVTLIGFQGAHRYLNGVDGRVKSCSPHFDTYVVELYLPPFGLVETQRQHLLQWSAAVKAEANADPEGLGRVGPGPAVPVDPSLMCMFAFNI